MVSPSPSYSSRDALHEHPEAPTEKVEMPMKGITQHAEEAGEPESRDVLHGHPANTKREAGGPTKDADSRCGHHRRWRNQRVNRRAAGRAWLSHNGAREGTGRQWFFQSFRGRYSCAV